MCATGVSSKQQLGLMITELFLNAGGNHQHSHFITITITILSRIDIFELFHEFRHN